MTYKASINVTLKKSVLDPQGKTVLQALGHLGFNEAKDLRVGKYFELSVDANDESSAEEKVKAMCDQVLINPVIEDYEFQLQSV